MKKLTCPNCKNKLHLVNKEKPIQLYAYDKKSFYDVWECEDCTHIKVLDWRYE